jgi:hypothetical protein
MANTNQRQKAFYAIILILTLVAAGAAWAETDTAATQTAPALPASVKHAVGKTGTVVVPDHFLRRWDPVTIFFALPTGPASGGPEDHPEKVVKMTPVHPGAFTWLDARTLQFKPAEPWPPLSRFRWEAGGATATLTTLMAAPVSTIPANNDEGLEQVDSITLTFPEPLDVPALTRMLTIELRPLPGISGSKQSRWLNGRNFEIKAMERASRSDQATYVITPEQPIGPGTRAIVHLRLSLEDTGESFSDLTFATAEPFRLTSAGCYEHRYPVTPEGTRYTAEQAIRCDSGDRTIVAEFSAAPREIGPIEGRNLVRITPPVANTTYAVHDRTLDIAGEFAWETVYTISFVPIPLQDGKGHPLQMSGASEIHVYFPRKAPYLKWGASEGIVERYGPQMVPVGGRGDERVDLRIYPIDPLDRGFWPFPDHAVTVDETQRPPGPGEEPKPFTAADRVVTEPELIAQISNLASPPVSEIIALPLHKEGSSASFGLDLQPRLTYLSGSQKPGTYLVGIRRLNETNQRTWMRIQVTDLSLSTVEEPDQVEFTVTSLSTAAPVVGAAIRIEGTLEETGQPAQWSTFAESTTDASGKMQWKAPGKNPAGRKNWTVRRLVVSSGDDVLVLDPTRAPESYADNQWSESEDTWLQWAFEDLTARVPEAEKLCHIFTERPLYRPEEEVHIKGYLRQRSKGQLILIAMNGSLVVDGPGGLEWRYPVTVNEFGSFYQKFAEKNIPTGDYSARLEDKEHKRYGNVNFKVEAYRIPTFEVQLHSPDQVPLDHEFKVNLTATYYAGGRVAGQPIQWRVTQFPYTWTPKSFEGFLYSSDGRFSSSGKFESTPRLEKQDTTDEQGGGSLTLDPAIEPTAQPRSYVIEATVTGPDDQTVTATKSVPALPPFVLGLKVPRYVEHTNTIEGEMIVVGPDNKLIPDMDITVRLLNRQWHSTLQAGDFSTGAAKYVTDVVDEKVGEMTVKSGADPVKLSFAIAQAGVYVVELEAHDRLDRAQVVSVDLYAAGEQPVAWAKPVSPVFSVAMDKDAYNPGDVANLVIKSPFQQSQALVIVEGPDRNEYSWLPVKGGAATFKLPVKNLYAPRVPVHFILMRGRIPTDLSAAKSDLGKPSTMASTAWVKVNPVDNQVNVKLTYPEKARPGQKIDIKIQLSTPQSSPLPGEVTLWLVDQAVLALGKEQRLDPIPDFIKPASSHLSVHDTRNMAFGFLPFAENPGGEAAENEGGLLERATVRRNFKSVPYYNPSIIVGPDGVVTITVELPDNLTNFKLRAKAVSGPDRFGVGTGQIAVRLPVIIQPSLPRFVRPGDSFTAVAIGRIVEGDVGPGAAEIKTTGATVKGPAKQEFAWVPNRPERIEYPVDIPTPAYNENGELSYHEASFTIGVERSTDGARDAFEVKLPIRDDREATTVRLLQDLEPGKAVALPEVKEEVRPGTLKTSLLVSGQPGLVRMAAGLDFLLDYPYECTEQRISRARAYIALKHFRDLLHQGGSPEEMDRSVKDTLGWIPEVTDSNGLCAYWPGGQTYVSLTAWVVQFLVEAKAAGYQVDDKLFNTLTGALEHALRSDYSHFISGEAFAERTWALAALAAAGRFNAPYAAELARKAQNLDLEATAEVLQSFARSGDISSATARALSQTLWDGLVIRLYQQREVYGGLQEQRACSPLILPSETRTVAEVTRALSRTQPDNNRLQVLVNALVTLGRDDGWGSTNANASALLALSELLKPPFSGTAPHSVALRINGKTQTLSIGPGSPVSYKAGNTPLAGDVTLQPGGDASPVVLRAEVRYIPAADGSQVAARSQGFVVTREMLKVGKEEDAKDRVPLNGPGLSLQFTAGDVVEEHVQIVNPKDRNYVAIVVPLAAGMEPLNPNLATAPPEAKASGSLTQTPTYAAFLDDSVSYYYDSLPKGTYDFYFRTRANTTGSFTQPAARAEMMYDRAVVGNSPGAKVVIAAKAGN